MMKSLVTLSLAKNKLSGMISTNISTSLQTVIISNNLLNGQIPAEIGKIADSTLFDFQGNSGITCYQPIPGINPQLGILNECVPTSSPTLFPTLSTAGGGLNNGTTIIIASAVSAVGLCFLIIFGAVYLRNRNKYRLLNADKKKRLHAIKDRLESLPIHKLFINEGEKRRRIQIDGMNNGLLSIIDNEELMRVVNCNSDTIHELDFEGNSVIDILLKYRHEIGSDDVILTVLRHCLPVRLLEDHITIEIVDKIIHNFDWIKIVTSPFILSHVAELILLEHPKLCEVFK